METTKETTEKTPNKKIHYKEKDVFVGENRLSGKPIFERKKVPVVIPGTSIDLQPSIDGLPPVAKDGSQEDMTKLTKIKPKKDQDPLF